MIENFTATYNEANKSNVQEHLAETDDLIITLIKQNIQNIAKEPQQSVVDNILSYSKSLNDK